MTADLGTGERLADDKYSAADYNSQNILMQEISVCSPTISPFRHTQTWSFLKDRERAKDFVELHDQVQVCCRWP